MVQYTRSAIIINNSAFERSDLNHLQNKPENELHIFKIHPYSELYARQKHLQLTENREYISIQPYQIVCGMDYAILLFWYRVTDRLLFDTQRSEKDS